MKWEGHHEFASRRRFWRENMVGCGAEELRWGQVISTDFEFHSLVHNYWRILRMGPSLFYKPHCGGKGRIMWKRLGVGVVMRLLSLIITLSWEDVVWSTGSVVIVDDWNNGPELHLWVSEVWLGWERHQELYKLLSSLELGSLPPYEANKSTFISGTDFVPESSNLKVLVKSSFF